MTDYDPLERADVDEQAASERHADAMVDFHIAANANSTADNLRQMGFGDAGDVLQHAADTAAGIGQTQFGQSQHLQAAAGEWRAMAHDLDEQGHATGQAYVAGASQKEAQEMLGQAMSDADRTKLEASAASSGAAETALEHRAAQLGQDAQSAARHALDDEAKGYGTR